MPKNNITYFRREPSASCTGQVLGYIFLDQKLLAITCADNYVTCPCGDGKIKSFTVSGIMRRSGYTLRDLNKDPYFKKVIG